MLNAVMVHRKNWLINWWLVFHAQSTAKVMLGQNTTHHITSKVWFTVPDSRYFMFQEGWRNNKVEWKLMTRQKSDRERVDRLNPVSPFIFPIKNTCSFWMGCSPLLPSPNNFKYIILMWRLMFCRVHIDAKPSPAHLHAVGILRFMSSA